MKKQNNIIKTIAVILTETIFAILSSACSIGKTRYNLSSGFLGDTNISNAYEYNYIELNEKEGSYLLKNKSKTNGIVIKQTGSYAINENNIMTITNNEIPTNDFFLGEGETIQVIGSSIIVSCYISYYGNCKMTFVRK